MRFFKPKIERDVSLPHGSIRWIILTQIAFKNYFIKSYGPH